MIDDTFSQTPEAPNQSGQPPFEQRLTTRSAKPFIMVICGITAVALMGFVFLVVWVVPRIRSVQDHIASSVEPAKPESNPQAPVSSVPSAKEQVAARTAAATASAKPADSETDAKPVVQPAAPSEPKLVLQGITYAADSRDAMINDITAHEGDEILGAKVVTIESRRVTLEFSGQRIVLSLP